MLTGVSNLNEAFESYRAWAQDPVPRIPFGWKFADEPTNGGLARSETCMIMSFSSVGKTTIALNVCRQNPHIPTLFFSLELSSRMVAARLAAQECGVGTRYLEQKYKHGEIPHEAVRTADKFRGFLIDDRTVNFKMMSEAMDKAENELGVRPRLVVIDYLTLMAGGGLMEKAAQVEKLAASIRQWTKEQDCSTIALHQVGKGPGGAEPLDLSDGKYGGHEPFDTVISAYAPRLKKGIDTAEYLKVKDEIWFQLLKNRAGEAEPVPIKHRKDPITMRITEWSAPVFQTHVQASFGDPEPEEEDPYQRYQGVM